MASFSLSRRLTAEALGTGFLVAAVVGSGIMAETLAGGNGAVALLCNTIPTGAVLFVLITIFAPISGAHLNPAVSFVMMLRGDLDRSTAAAYIAVQIVGGCLGTIAAHMMFDLSPLQFSAHARNGLPQWIAEFVATFGLLMTILGCVRFRPDAVAPAVGLYITSAYWFTASTRHPLPTRRSPSPARSATPSQASRRATCRRSSRRSSSARRRRRPSWRGLSKPAAPPRRRR
jgi:glycerol uptake facilitator-like aquaporin